MIGDDTNYVSAIDVKEKEVVKSFQLPPRDSVGALTTADGIVFSPDGSRLMYETQSGYLNGNHDA